LGRKAGRYTPLDNDYLYCLQMVKRILTRAKPAIADLQELRNTG
jgi:hypothetical protein